MHESLRVAISTWERPCPGHAHLHAHVIAKHAGGCGHSMSMLILGVSALCGHVLCMPQVARHSGVRMVQFSCPLSSAHAMLLAINIHHVMCVYDISTDDILTATGKTSCSLVAKAYRQGSNNR